MQIAAGAEGLGRNPELIAKGAGECLMRAVAGVESNLMSRARLAVVPWEMKRKTPAGYAIGSIFGVVSKQKRQFSGQPSLRRGCVERGFSAAAQRSVKPRALTTSVDPQAAG